MMIKKMYSGVQGCNSASRLEKKYVEKKRRSNMNLFNHLCSLLPPHPSQVFFL